MLQIEDLERLQKEITYKPGWEFHFKVRPEYCFDLHCYIMYDGIDPVTGKSVKLCQDHWIRGNEWYEMTEDKFLHNVLNWLHAVESHEIKEWFRVRGTCVVNPHQREAR